MAHYKNNNKNNFIPTENKKKKKKFTKEQLIVFILMIFWTISSVLGIIAFTSNVVKAEEPLTVYAEEPDYNYSPPKYTDVNYNEFNPCSFPTMNLLGADYMVNDSFQYDKNNNRYRLTRTAESYVSEWFYFPFTLYEGDYIATVEDFTNSSANATQVSLQFQTSNGVNYYVRFKMRTSLGVEDISVSFNLSNVTGSPIIAKNIDKVRFICSNSYEVDTFFYFRNPTLYRSDIAYPYSPYFGTYCDIASDYAYEKGWQDSGEAFDEGYDEGYAKGVEDTETAFRDKYGYNDLGVLNDVRAYGEVAGYSSGDTDIQYFEFSDVAPTVVSNNCISFDFLWLKSFHGFDEVEYVDIYLYFPTLLNSIDNPFYVNEVAKEIIYTPMLYDSSVSNIAEGLWFNFCATDFFDSYDDRESVINDDGNYKLLPWSGVDFQINFNTEPYNVLHTVLNADIQFVSTPKPRTLYFYNYNSINSISYQFGYDTGKKDGIIEATSTEYFQNAIENAKEVGKALGYNEGVKDANDYSFLSLMGAVVDAPLNAFIRMFDFDILGFNMKSLYLSLFTACLLIVIVKKVI